MRQPVGGTLSLRGISIMNGSTSGLGSGIRNARTLRLDTIKFSGNTAGNGDALANLAGATADVSDAVMDKNTTTGVGGGGILVSGGLGGGISNLGTTSLNLTQVRMNKGSSGGGIATGNNNVTLQHSLVSRNTPDNCSPLNTIRGCVNLPRSVERETNHGTG